MAGRTPDDAYRTYVDPIADALRCVTQKRVLRPEQSKLTSNVAYGLSLNDMEPVPLKGEWAVTLTVGQRVRIDAVDRDAPRGPFVVRLIQYLYSFAATEGTEILGFHWTPDAIGQNVITVPHLHIGRALTAGQAAIRPFDFHKAHIPTGHVSVAAIVRLAIAEFGVTPLRPDWERVLERAETIAAS